MFVQLIISGLIKPIFLLIEAFAEFSEIIINNFIFPNATVGPTVLFRGA